MLHVLREISYLTYDALTLRKIPYRRERFAFVMAIQNDRIKNQER
jgi:hypothetical protein